MIVIEQDIGVVRRRIEIRGVAEMDDAAMAKHWTFLKAFGVGCAADGKLPESMTGAGAEEPSPPKPKRRGAAKPKGGKPKEAKAAGRGMTDEEIKAFKDLWAANASAGGIADQFGKTESWVYARARALGLKRRAKSGRA